MARTVPQDHFVVRPCTQCGTNRLLSYRAAVDYDKGITSGRCRACLYGFKINVTQAAKRYWLRPAYEADGRKIHDGFTIAQIKELAAGLEPLLGDHSRVARPRLHDGERQWAR